MKKGLLVLKPGVLTTVQDQGRFGYRRIGVPVSGALDGESLLLANALAGNPPQCAGLEILYGGPVFKVAAQSVRVALAGGQGRIAIRGGPSIPFWQSLTLEEGAEFEILPDRRVASSYLAVEGGFAVPLFLGSASTFARAGFGGFEGRALKEGDLLPLLSPRAAQRQERRLKAPPPFAGDERIRVVLGPQADRFEEEALSLLCTAEFRVSASADRMGMRLEGPRLSVLGGWDIVSDAIPNGAIQIPGSGQPILLLADHQTTGGYAKIATVISVDLPVVGRRRPGDRVLFSAVGVEEAEALARDKAKSLAALLRELESVPFEDLYDRGRLYGENLISGVVSGRD